MRLLHHLYPVVLLLLVIGPVRADNDYYDCVVVERLQLTEKGYRPYPAPDPKLRQRLTIDKQSGAVSGAGSSNFEWERIRVVKTSPLYNIFMTRGYGSDGTPVKEVVVSKWQGVTQFVSIDVLTDLEILDGTCE